MKDKGEVAKVKGKVTKKKVVAKTVSRSAQESGRARAWLFLLVKDTGDLTERLKDIGIFEAGGDEYVVIRADIVKRSADFPYNIVIPIDAADEGMLDRQVERILRVSSPTNHAVALVREHVPFPPHVSHAYVTEEEFEIEPDEIEKPGRQGNSPGGNPWG